MTNIELEAPAKINLTLDVKGKRPDGYHELETIMHPIDLTDKIIVRAAARGIKLSSSSRAIPLDETNLAYRAADKILPRFAPGRGVEIYIEKNIPVGAGLAGGSTDAAAVLRGINALYRLEISPAQLHELALEIGSDVPFCLLRQTSIARGRGEKLTPLKEAPQLNILMVKPPFQVSTTEEYQKFDLNKVDNSPNSTAFIEAWNNCDIINIAKNMVNVLETVCLSRFPEIKAIKQAIIELGALNAIMSGSGPTVFGIFQDQEKACQAGEVFKARYQEVYMVSSYIRGD